MPRVVYFEFHADDPERAIDFRQGLCGWVRSENLGSPRRVGVS
jgi:predicted enzyme related to lactoylglutathione lyase